MNLIDATVLRSLTVRVASQTVHHLHHALSQTLATITSPFFSEFILEMEKVPATLGPGWTEPDEMFERMDIERGFRVIIRAEEVDRDSNFIVQAEDLFPLMAARKRIVFEVGPFPEK